uniref:Uncharacterized protein n=1 Tax=Anaerobacillus isosaccharinicus TaxID=1532552 RepID=A0A1S2KY77_9BACI
MTNRTCQWFKMEIPRAYLAMPSFVLFALVKPLAKPLACLSRAMAGVSANQNGSMCQRSLVFIELLTLPKIYTYVLYTSRNSLYQVDKNSKKRKG